jgi:hypothetical protein
MWLVQEQQASELKVVKLCAAGKLAGPCMNVLGAPDQETSGQHGQTIWIWKSGSILSANSDSAIVSKRGVIVEILDLDHEVGKRRFRELYSDIK